MAQFRFMELDIWKESISLNDFLYDLADNLIEVKNFRMAEQLRAASLSISNNIAEGSGSDSSKDFARFLVFSKRSSFEVANISIVMGRRNFITKEQLDQILKDLEYLSKRITNFRKSLLKDNQNGKKDKTGDHG